MATVTFQHASRTYPGTDAPAVDALDLEIGDGPQFRGSRFRPMDGDGDRAQGALGRACIPDGPEGVHVTQFVAQDDDAARSLGAGPVRAYLHVTR